MWSSTLDGFYEADEVVVVAVGCGGVGGGSWGGWVGGDGVDTLDGFYEVDEVVDVVVDWVGDGVGGVDSGGGNVIGGVDGVYEFFFMYFLKLFYFNLIMI